MTHAVIEFREGRLSVLDQTLLPRQAVMKSLDSLAEVVEAIVSLRVRGAPLIGVSAAYGVCVALREAGTAAGARELAPAILKALAESRPTAVNLFWALDRMEKVISRLPEENWLNALQEEAKAIHQETLAQDTAMAHHGVELLVPNARVITHCNTGPLATGGLGTALGVLIYAHKTLGGLHVHVDETRPRWQGAALTTWELANHSVPHTLMVDSAAATLMRKGGVHSVWVGADRIAANGDTANKIGTFPLALAAKHHGVPFYVAAPTSTMDPALPNGDQIPIEERDGSEVASPWGLALTPEGTQVWNPAFDITPAALITAIVTEKGALMGPVYDLKKILD